MRISSWSSDVFSSDLPLLQWAMLHQDRGSYRLLLDLRADPARVNADGHTALHLAAMGKDEFWLDDLLERGVSPVLPHTVRGEPPLLDDLPARLPENVDPHLKTGARTDTHHRHDTPTLPQPALVHNLLTVLHYHHSGPVLRATATTRDTPPP